MTPRARPYDANGEDRDVELTRAEVDRIDDRRLRWVVIASKVTLAVGILAVSRWRGWI